METEKGTRLLYLYQDLISGRGIQKQNAASRFGVNERSIRRDIEDLWRQFWTGFLRLKSSVSRMECMKSERRRLGRESRCGC